MAVCYAEVDLMSADWALVLIDKSRSACLSIWNFFAHLLDCKGIATLFKRRALNNIMSTAQVLVGYSQTKMRILACLFGLLVTSLPFGLAGKFT